MRENELRVNTNYKIMLYVQKFCFSVASLFLSLHFCHLLDLSAVTKQKFFVNLFKTSYQIEVCRTFCPLTQLNLWA